MITASQVNALRQITGAGMMACKKALTEANGDNDLAIDILRKKGESKAVEKSDRDTSEGAIFYEIKDHKGAIISLGCETDFVARNEKFQALGKELAKMALEENLANIKTIAEVKIKELIGIIGENMKLVDIKIIEAETIGAYLHTNGKIGVLIGVKGDVNVAKDVAMHAAAMFPKVFSPNDIDVNLIAKEREIWTEQLKNEKKPENIINNILIGKEKKFKEENALLTQAFVKDPSQTVEAYAKAHQTEILNYARLTV